MKIYASHARELFRAFRRAGREVKTDARFCMADTIPIFNRDSIRKNWLATIRAIRKFRLRSHRRVNHQGVAMCTPASYSSRARP